MAEAHQAGLIIRKPYDPMIGAGVPLAAHHDDHLTAAGMTRVKDPDLDYRTPGIMTLVRAGSARAGWPARSGTRPAARTCPSSTSACRGCSRPWRWRAATGATASSLRTLARVRLLVLDDWGPEPLTAEQARDPLEIVEDRYDAGSILFTSQVPIDRWYDLIGIPTLADAILDRVVHNAYRIELSGESLRKSCAPEPAA